MRMHKLVRAAVTATVFLGGFGAAGAVGNPPIHMVQGVEYMCGGRNADEQAFMRTVAPRWAATLEFGIARDRLGRLPGRVSVLVRSKATGEELMTASTGEPYMLMRLEPGSYEVTATLAGLTLTQDLNVFAGGASHADFHWPSNIDYAAAQSLPRSEQQAAASLPRQ